MSASVQNTPKPVGSPARPPAPDTLPLPVLIKALDEFRPTIPNGTEISKCIDNGLVILNGIKNDVIDSPVFKITVDPMRVSTRELRASVQPLAASGALLPSVADKFEALGHLSTSMMSFQVFFSPAFINVAKPLLQQHQAKYPPLPKPQIPGTPLSATPANSAPGTPVRSQSSGSVPTVQANTSAPVGTPKQAPTPAIQQQQPPRPAQPQSVPVTPATNKSVSNPPSRSSSSSSLPGSSEPAPTLSTPAAQYTPAPPQQQAEWTGPYAWAKVDPRFFTAEFDPMLNLFSQLPSSNPDPSWYLNQARTYEYSCDQVDQKLSQKVMQSYDSFVVAMKKIQHLHEDLQASTLFARDSKDGLALAKDHLAVAGLRIVALYKKRQRYRAIIELLLELKQLFKLRQITHQAAIDGNFVRAIQSCLKAREVVKTFSAFPSIAKMNYVIREEYSNVKNKLDSALADCCRSFVPQAYERVLGAHYLILDPARISDAHLRHFKGVIETAAKRSVLAHVLMNPQNTTNAEALEQLNFGTLCKRLTQEQFVPCLNLVLEQYCEILYSHFQMVNWLAKRAAADQQGIGNLFLGLSRGLENFKRYMWEGGMQRRLSVLLAAQSLVNYPFERFVPIIESLNKITSVAEEFIGGKAHRLRDKITELSNSYFDVFHRNRMEELSMALENELYTVMTLPKGYSFRDLKELRHFVDSFGIVLPRAYTRRPLSFFVQFETSGNPFTPENLARDRSKQDAKNPKSPTGQRRARGVDDEEIDPALLVSSVDEMEGRSTQTQNQSRQDVRQPTAGPVVTSVTLTLVKFIGKYLDLMRVMEHIAPEIFQGMLLAIDLYVYTTFSNLSLPTTLSHTRINPFFNSHMNDVKNNLVYEPPPPPSMAAGIGAALTLNTVQMQPPPIVIPTTILNPSDPLSKPNPAVFKVKKPQLHQSLRQSSHQIIPSAIAAESVMFLFETLDSLKTIMRGLLPREKQPAMDNFTEHTASALPHLRELIYRGLANKIISAQKLLPIVQDVKWDSEQMPPENNEYVNAIGQTMGEFLPKIRQAIKGGVYPEDILQHIWGFLIIHACEVMVEGWSRAKKCTVQGRALMQLDVTMFRNKLDKMSAPSAKEPASVNLTKQVDKVHFAEEYAKATWLSADELWNWINQHGNMYTKLQLINLVNVGTWDKAVKVKCIDFLQRKPW